MRLREDILKPIEGDNPSGVYLRASPVYDKIKEARRQDDDLPQGAWQHERKLADFGQVIKLAEDAIAGQSKDLQLAAWLSEALLKKHGYAGWCEGMALCRGLLEGFWDTLYPEIEDGDAEFRAGPLEWIGAFDAAIKGVPLCAAGHDFFAYQQSRTVGYEETAKSKDEKAAREAALKAGKLAPEIFDKAFGETPKAFYAGAEKALDASLAELAALGRCAKEKFGESAPSFGRLERSLEEVRRVIHAFLQKKRELEPDPVEEAPLKTSAEEQADGTAVTGADPIPTFSIEAPEEPADRKEAIAAVVQAAAFLRKREPKSPAPYLMLRGLRWGEVRAAVAIRDWNKLEAPPTDVRRLAKRLASEGKWKELIEVAENLMAMPCSRAWLDLQRLVVDGCVALGSDYGQVALAIRSELRALVRDVPELLSATLTDDTPVANAETQAWLRELSAEPESATPRVPLPAATLSRRVAGSTHKYVDSYDLAVEALRSGQEQKAFEILQAELLRETSGRGRFERRLQLVQLCVSTGKEAIMQPLLEDLLAAVEGHKLEDWEDRQMLASALVTILRASKKLQGDAKEKQKMFERICRLDSAQALTAA